MLIAVTSIGLHDYKEVEYVWVPAEREACSCRTALFPLAIDAFFQPDKLLLLVTPEARAHGNYRKIERELGERFLPVPIPAGKNESELWQIFDIVSAAVPERAEVIFDVTHAFRSLPLLIFGVIVYLRRAKGVRLERIVYGAFEAGEEGKDGALTRAPVFDLTVLADLQDWLQAIDAFAVRSDGERLADLLTEAHRRPWVGGEKGNGELPRQLQNMARCIRTFSESLRLMRPLDTARAAARAQTLARQVEQEAARWAKPFSHMLSTFTGELSVLAAEKPEILDAGELRRQLALIKHYVEKDLIVQAILLAREWMVSWLAWRVNREEWLNQGVRDELERALGSAFYRLRGGVADVPPWYDALPEADRVTKSWDALTNLRNDVAHCAMNSQPAPPEHIRKESRKMLQYLAELLEERRLSLVSAYHSQC